MKLKFGASSFNWCGSVILMRYNLVTLNSSKPCIISCVHALGRVPMIGMRCWLIPVDDGPLVLSGGQCNENRSHQK